MLDLIYSWISNLALLSLGLVFKRSVTYNSMWTILKLSAKKDT